MLNIYETKAMKKYLADDFLMGGYEHHQIVFPKHVLVCAGTGGGKTSWLLNYLNLSSKGTGTFGHITIVCKQIEPAYEMLQDRLKKQITIHTSLNQLPPLKDFGNAGEQQLLVFDDCVNNKDQTKIEEYFLRARKFGAGVQLVYLSQSYFKTPIFIRQNITYLILLTLSSDADLARIMSNYNVGVTKEALKKIFKNAIRQKFCCFKIDIGTVDLNRKFSKNWTDFYTLVDEDGEMLPLNSIALHAGNGLLN